jgi:hypothetical protein
VFFYSADRAGIHPERHLAGYSGILQADAHAGFNTVYKPDRKSGPITEAACWAHGRRKLFELADIASKAGDRKPTTIAPMVLACDGAEGRQDAAVRGSSPGWLAQQKTHPEQGCRALHRHPAAGQELRDEPSHLRRATAVRYAALHHRRLRTAGRAITAQQGIADHQTPIPIG